MNHFNTIIAITLLVAITATTRLSAQQSEWVQLDATPDVPAALDWESANAKRMFILTNAGSPISAIVFDSTHKDDLQAALKLQELVHRISGARLPLVDKQFVTVPWGKVHIAWDHFPATEPVNRYLVRMMESDPTSYNPQKQIIIGGNGPNIEQAISAFTKAAFGVPLESLQDKSYQWEPRKTLAVPENFETIHESCPRRFDNEDPPFAAQRSEADRELAADLALLQGTWELLHGNEGKGPPNTRSVKTIEGNTETLRRYSVATGKLSREHSVEFKLSKSGDVRVFTFYAAGGSPQDGLSYLYKVDQDNFFDIPGMLHGDQFRNYQTEPKVWHWKRVVGNDSDSAPAAWDPK